MPSLCNYCFPHGASITGAVTLSPFHYVTCLPYSSKSRTVLVVLPQLDLVRSPSSNFFIITTVPFRENNFSPHSSVSQIAMLSFYHHDRYLAYFNSTDILHVSARKVHRIFHYDRYLGTFQRYRYMAYFSTTDMSHILPRQIYRIFHHDEYLAYFSTFTKYEDFDLADIAPCVFVDRY